MTEVRFAPPAGEPSFIEIANHGSSAIDIAGMRLVVHGTGLSLAGFTQPLAPGAIVLVILDGASTTGPGVLHAPSGVTLGADDSIDLIDATGSIVDRVAWGLSHPNGVPLSAGGFIDDVEPGMTLGRSPSAVLADQPLEWSVYPPGSASPGVANALPGVGVRLPLSGAVVSGSGASLAWYPVVGASEYRIQASTDPGFATTVLDSTTIEPQLETGDLASGEYFWRVAAVEAGEGASAFSVASTFEVAAGGLGARSSGSRAVPAVNLAENTLQVDLISQRKDTAMLLLERNVETGAHPWDADHGTLDPKDPSDNKNCAIASVAMVNHYFGGDLSQDRIAFEVFKARAPGPELDMLFGGGTDQEQVAAAMAFALGAPSEHMETGHSPDAVWAAVTASIDAGRPVVAAGLKHTFVFTGYSNASGKRLLAVNDPWNYAGRSGKSTYNIDANDGLSAAVLDLWIPPAGAVGRQQEPSVRSDGDGDGMVDFDESERFKTNPNSADTDGDKLPDKQDVISGIFDSTFGYARNPKPESQGRDYDFDDLPTERDSDSDRGGCQDGSEDKSLDGHRNGAETWNFDTQDDGCGGWRGTMSATLTWSTSHGNGAATSTFKGTWTETDNKLVQPCQAEYLGAASCIVYLPEGSIDWTWHSVKTGPNDDERCEQTAQGAVPAGGETTHPDLQMLVLQPMEPDGFAYYGHGYIRGIPQATCWAALEANNKSLPQYFSLSERASAENPVSVGNTCYSTSWLVDPTGKTIEGSCVEYDYGYTKLSFEWQLTRFGPAAPG